MPRESVRFIRKVVCLSLPVFGVLVPLLFIGKTVGELVAVRDVPPLEMRHPGDTLYLRGALGQAITGYKFTELIAHKPEVLVLGSSRAMQLRAEMFPGMRFYNAGGIINDVKNFGEILDLIPSTQTPKVIFAELDSFTFGSKRKEGNPITEGIADDVNLSFLQWRPYVAVMKKLFISIIADPRILTQYLNPRETITGHHAIGLGALAGNGFRSDGSFQYGTHLLELRKDATYKDAINPPVIERIKKGLGQFAFESSFVESRIEQLRSFLVKARTRGILVIMFAPPYSQEAYHSLTTLREQRELFSRFEAEVPRLSQEEQVPYFDFSDITKLGLTDNSMFDGFHMTEVAAAEIVLRALSAPRVREKQVFDLSIGQNLSRRVSRAHPFEIDWDTTNGTPKSGMLQNSTVQ